MRQLLAYISVICIFNLPSVTIQCQQAAGYVNTMIGTANGGNTMPGALVPWGMAHSAPQNTRSKVWSGSRYYFGEEFMYGFGQIHLSGVGCGDFGNLSMMPVIGVPTWDYNKTRSRYSNEITQAGYYKVDLINANVKADFTATEHSTLSRFLFLNDENPHNLVFDISEGLSTCRHAVVRFVSDVEMEGYIDAGGFCGRNNTYRLHFVMQFNKKAIKKGYWKDKIMLADTDSISGTSIGAWVSFSPKDTASVIVKTGLSFVSIANARQNLQVEQPDWNFEQLRKKAFEKWNEQLSKITINDTNQQHKIVFYTALYHALIHPSIISDVNGEYPAMHNKKIKKAIGRRQFHVFSLWDTYRTLHPLLTLVYPQVQTEILQTMADMASETGDLPFWELGADESYVMNGDPCAPVITDSYNKGLRNFDVQTAFNAMCKSAYTGDGNKIRPMNKYYMRYGWLPYDDCGPNDEWGKPRMVSECLEYAFADWCTANLAKSLGQNSIYEHLYQRSLAYRYYFDTIINFIRQKYTNGKWVEPFIPYGADMVSMPGFVEGNSWQYTFFVPHDITGLMKLMGGAAPFVNKLQQCFDEKKFTINNEPDIAYPYLFTYVKNEEWRTQKIVRRIMEIEYTNTPGGIPGNDDAGTLSAWYVFSALGIYPDCPGSTTYRIGSPLFRKATINLDPIYYSGAKFVINAPENTSKNVYVKYKMLNGKTLQNPVINHSQITNGGILKFELIESR